MTKKKRQLILFCEQWQVLLGSFILLFILLLNRAEVFVTDCFISFQVLVNTACCFLMLVAKLIQCMVFGPLRVSERQVRQQTRNLSDMTNGVIYYIELLKLHKKNKFYNICLTICLASISAATSFRFISKEIFPVVFYKPTVNLKILFL